MSISDRTALLETMLAEELKVSADSPEAVDAYKVTRASPADTVDGLHRENKRLSNENYLLRRQINMVQENSSLRVANILAKILSWFDDEPENDAINRQTLEYTIKMQTDASDISDQNQSAPGPKPQTYRSQIARASEHQTVAEETKSDIAFDTSTPFTVEDLAVTPAEDKAVAGAPILRPSGLFDNNPPTIPTRRANSITNDDGVQLVWSQNARQSKQTKGRRQSIIQYVATVLSNSSCEHNGSDDTDSESSQTKLHIAHSNGGTPVHASGSRNHGSFMGNVDVAKPHGYVWERKSSSAGDNTGESSILGGAINNQSSLGYGGLKVKEAGHPVAASTPNSRQREPNHAQDVSHIEVPREHPASMSRGLFDESDDLIPIEPSHHVARMHGDEHKPHLTVDTRLAQDAEVEPPLETPINDESQAAVFSRSPDTVVRKKTQNSSESKKSATRPKTVIAKSRYAKSRDHSHERPSPIAASALKKPPAHPFTVKKIRPASAKPKSSIKSIDSKKKKADSNNNNADVAGAVEMKPSISLQAAAILQLKPTHRLMGEVAFQLDRRILGYVFHKKTEKEKRRFYGYIIQNIPDKIDRESSDYATGLIDGEKRYVLEYRYNYVLSSLRPFGYSLDKHPEFAADMVNKYGLLPIPSVKEELNTIGPECRRVLKDLIMQICPSHEMHDMMVLLDCLALMARDDGKPIFMH